MSDREIMDAKNGIMCRESYGFRDPVVKNVVDKFVDRWFWINWIRKEFRR